MGLLSLSSNSRTELGLYVITSGWLVPSENGEELVTFASSEYPEKPTLQQIQRSIDRYRVCLTMYGDTISDEIEKVDLSVYMFTD
ncbi:hypothetical protein NXW75_05170 [Bacteroides xylanisolvens]|nr:hypothetical protein [Bacteroides xylanisolvens]